MARRSCESLEAIFQSELNDAIRLAAGGARDFAERAGADGLAWAAELRSIEGVEEFGPERERVLVERNREAAGKR